MRTHPKLTHRVVALVAILAVAIAGARTAPVVAASHPRVVMQTPLGDIVVEIYLDRAPITAANFLAYVDDNLFGGVHFYRVVTIANQPSNDVKIEVIQGGLGFGEADRKASIDHETTAVTGIAHLDGTLSMARVEPGTATSEFFICVGDQPELDFGGARNPDGQGFAAFGRVIQGMDVVHAIHRQEVTGQMLTDPVPITTIERLGSKQ